MRVNIAHGKKIEIFIPDPDTAAITSIKLMGWAGAGLRIARDEIKDCVEYGITGAGVYLLFCEDENGDKAVYIGESLNVQKRLKQHIKDYDSDIEKFYWSTAVVFTGSDLHKTLIQYIERQLVGLAKKSGQYKILTKATCDL